MKVDPTLIQRLLDEQLATLELDAAQGEVLRVAPGLAALYMTILARKISDGGIPIITDRPKYLRLCE